MAKQKPDHGGVIPLCREFMIEVNRRSSEQVFKNQPARDVTKQPAENAIRIVREFIGVNAFANRFPQIAVQDSIGYLALLKSGVEFRQVKKALKEEGLQNLMHIVGHAVSAYEVATKMNKNMPVERQIALIEAATGPV